MNRKTSHKKKKPFLTIDKSISDSKYADSPFVQKKLAEATETIRRVGLPKLNTKKN